MLREKLALDISSRVKAIAALAAISAAGVYTMDKGRTVPYVFSQPDLILPATDDTLNVKFISGLSGAGKTTHSYSTGLPIYHIDDFPDDPTMKADYYFNALGDHLRGLLSDNKPMVIEGVQAPYFRDIYPNHEYLLKRTSFLESLINQSKRDYENGGLKNVLLGLSKIPKRIKNNIKFKNRIEQAFSEYVEDI